MTNFGRIFLIVLSAFVLKPNVVFADELGKPNAAVKKSESTGAYYSLPVTTLNFMEHKPKDFECKMQTRDQGDSILVEYGIYRVDSDNPSKAIHYGSWAISKKNYPMKNGFSDRANGGSVGFSEGAFSVKYDSGYSYKISTDPSFRSLKQMLVEVGGRKIACDPNIN